MKNIIGSTVMMRRNGCSCESLSSDFSLLQTLLFVSEDLDLLWSLWLLLAVSGAILIDTSTGYIRLCNQLIGSSIHHYLKTKLTHHDTYDYVDKEKFLFSDITFFYLKT